MLDCGFYNMDCMEGMRGFASNYFDLAIVDPQYGLGESAKNFASRSNLANADKYIRKEWDNKIPDEEYFTELFRIAKNSVIWGGNYFIKHLDSTPCMIVWDKANGGNDFADCEIAWTSFKTAVRKFTWRWAGMLQQNMKHKDVRIHPTQKPIALYQWILQNYAEAGWKILDTHVGSGSSLIACEREGFKYVGFEIDEDYYKDAVKRIKRETAQLRLL